MKIAIGSDHGGFALKQILIQYLEEKGYEMADLGTHSEDSVDYPVYGHKVAHAVLTDEIDRGILVCGTGIGIGIAANKVKGVRAALCYDVDTARLSREHNNANIISMGGRTTDVQTAKDMVDVFLTTDFEGGRHQRRVDMMEDDNE